MANALACRFSVASLSERHGGEALRPPPTPLQLSFFQSVKFSTEVSRFLLKSSAVKQSCFAMSNLFFRPCNFVVFFGFESVRAQAFPLFFPRFFHGLFFFACSLSSVNFPRVSLEFCILFSCGLTDLSSGPPVLLVFCRLSSIVSDGLLQMFHRPRFPGFSWNFLTSCPSFPVLLLYLISAFPLELFLLRSPLFDFP